VLVGLNIFLTHRKIIGLSNDARIQVEFVHFDHRVRDFYSDRFSNPNVVVFELAPNQYDIIDTFCWFSVCGVEQQKARWF
jgi:hypothetical protein